MREIWATYQAAWEDVDDSERLRLLEASVAENGVYADPNALREGRTAIVEHIAGFRGQQPGMTFRNHTFAEHHGQSLASWTLYDAAGAEIAPGTSWAEYGADGRLVRVSGFF